MRSLAAHGPRAMAALLALLVVTALAAGPVAAQTDAPPMTMRIGLQADGDARWTVTLSYPLESANETRGFDRLAEQYEADEVDTLAADPFRNAADAAAAATGRPMAITDVRRLASRSDGTGELTLTFTWTNFTAVDGDTVQLGDVFQDDTGTGTWLPRLTDRQELRIEFPEGYEVIGLGDFQSASRRIENRTLYIEGPAEFQPGEPSATLERGGAVNGPTDTPPETPTGPGGSIVPIVGVAALLVLVLGIILVRVRWRRPDRDDEPPAAAPAPDDGDVDEELLSDEERVLRLLREHGGRMKQVDIVEATDWSNAKVSQLLSEMDEADRIDKLRIGRENLISLPDRTPDGLE